ncbi:MAG: hypothetical protein K2R98_29605 [Gemmataceae bacterium]|nr:hypothetical protein [Gemmataceae bacterium]
MDSYFQLGEYDRAIADWTEVLELDGTDRGVALCYRGEAYHAKGSNALAVADYDEALRIDPQDIYVLRKRAMAWDALKEYKKAIADFHEAMQIEPQNRHTRNDLAWLLATCPEAPFRDGRRAIELAVTACESSEWKAAPPIDTLAAAHAECGDFAKAIEFQCRAIELAGSGCKADYQVRLNQYLRGLPYREPSAAGVPPCETESKPMRFLRTVVEMADSMNLNVKPGKDGDLKVSDSSGNSVSVNIKRLYQKVAKDAPSDWPSSIETYLRSVGPARIAAAGRAFQDGLAAHESDLLPYFKPSFAVLRREGIGGQAILIEDSYHQAVVDALSDLSSEATAERSKVVRNKNAASQDGLCVTIALDTEDNVVPVPEAVISESGRPVTEWLELSLRNLLARTPADWFCLVHEASGLCAAEVKDCYDASRALILDKLLPGKAPQGWFVAPLGRDDLYFMPATPDTANQMALHLKQIVEEEFPNTQYGLSDELYWVHAGRWYLYSFVTLQGGQIVACPPEEFCRVFGLLDQIADQQR